MAITVTKNITGLTVLNNTDNIIKKVQITIKCSDDSDPSNLTIEDVEDVELNISGITTNTVGFTTFANLTESQILSWNDVNRAILDSEIMLNKELLIEDMKNPGTSLNISKEIPW